MTGESTRLRFGVVAIVCISLFAALFARLWYLQVMNAPAYSQVAVNRAERTLTIAPPRGRIFDRNGNLLVDNKPTKVVAVDRQALAKVKDSDAVVGRLAGLLNRYQKPAKPFTLAGIKVKLANNRVGPYDPVPIDEGIDDRLLVYLTEHAAEFPGVTAETQLLRQYRYGSLAAQLLGYVGPISDSQWSAHRHDKVPYQKDDRIGRAGVEQSFERYLRGTPGKRVVEIDPTGRIVRTVSITDPVPGDDVYLSIDANAQALAESKLSAELAAAKPRCTSVRGCPAAPAGAAVLLQPDTGQVLALASNPAYDPTQFVPSISNAAWAKLNDAAAYAPISNRAVAGLYLPGSTWKLVTTLAGLKSGLISPDLTIDDPGSWAIIGCSGGADACVRHNDNYEANGLVNLPTAITRSSDVYYYRIGDLFMNDQKRYGATPIQDMARALGFGKRTGIELSDEQAGRVPDARWLRRYANQIHHPENGTWYSGDNLNLAIGQGYLAVTPLQLANAYAQFANGGTRYQPTLLYKVTKAFDESAVVKRAVPKAVAHMDIQPSWRAAMLQGFAGVTTDPHGTATYPFATYPMDKFPVGGKTGTAEIGNDPKTGQPRFSDAFFVGFGPVASPRYVGMAVLEQAGYGADAAAPVVRDIFQPVATSGRFPRVEPLIPIVASPGTTSTTTSSTTTTLFGSAN